MPTEIKTKEELAQEHHMIQHGLSVGKAQSHAALTLEYAEQEAISFAEWMAENNIWWNKTYKKWTGVESYTTSELYTLYRQTIK